MDTAVFVVGDAVLRHGGFRSAARALGRPAPTVAAGFRRLEAALATDLAFQSGSSLTLTFEARRIAAALAGLAELAAAVIAPDLPAAEARRAAAARPLPLAGLRQFLEALDAGSVRMAARRIGLGQPQLSRRLSRLEEIAGRALLERTATGCRANTDGARVAALAADLIARWERLSTTAARDFSRQTRTLRLGSIVPLGHESQIARMLANLVARWRQPARRSHLLLKSMPAEELVRELKAGRLDFALLDMDAAGAGLEGRVIGRSRLALVGPAGTSIRGETAGEILARDPVAVPTLRSGLRRAVKDVLDAAGVLGDQTPANFTETDSIPVIVNLVRDHGFVSVLPLASVDGVIAGIEAIALPAIHDLPLVLAWAPGRDLDAVAGDILADLRA